jgi:DNA-binding IclR family transcriptional regulator
MTGPRRGTSPARRSDTGHTPAVNRSVVRALSILELLSRSEGPVALGEVATRLKLPKSSALSLLRALVAGEFCVTDDRGHYALGVHTFEVGAGYLRSMTPVRSVTPELEWLTEVLGVTSHFAVLEHDEVIYLAKHDPPGLGLKLASSLGARLPAAVTAVGKAQLAYRDVAQRARPPRGAPRAPKTGETPKTGEMPGTGQPPETVEMTMAAQEGGTPGANGRVRGEHEAGGRASEQAGGQAELVRELQAVRSLGYAVDDGQTAVGIRCVAAPLFNDGGCCGAIGVSYLLGGGPLAPTVAEAVVEAASRASARLGGRQQQGAG